MSSERIRATRKLTPEGGSTEPLAALLRDGLEEARVQSMWQRIDHAPARHSGLWLALATAAVVVLLSFGVIRSLTPQGSGQLALVTGGAPVVLSAEAGNEAPRFEDGSQISLRQGSRLEVLRNDARSFVTALRRGDATFDVRPGGKRHWVVEAGELSVEVVGTRFRVDRQAEGTQVSVEHGVVLVRGERVTGGSVRLTAGQSFMLQSLPPPTASAQPIPAAASAFAPLQTPSTNLAAPLLSAAALDRVARELAAADEARRHADGPGAIRHFEAAWSGSAAGDARRGVIALSLARLLIAKNPAKAAQILRSSLSDMPSALREDAQARLVEAESRAGNRAGAQQAAEEYRRRFPAGIRLHEVERWFEP